MEQEPYIYFGSGATHYYQKLSNLASFPVTINANDWTPELRQHFPLVYAFFVSEPTQSFTFPSIEHVWQALKTTTKDVFIQFCEGGRFSWWDIDFFATISNPNKAFTKLKYWRGKDLIGIIAKMAVNEKYAKKLGLVGKINYELEALRPSIEKATWLWLLRFKYTQNRRVADILFATGGKQLVEFDRGAGCHHAHWGGLVDKTSNQVIGDNVMGKYLTLIRDDLRF